jgi:dTDP-glucose 4,6-dehydratase
MKFTDKKILVTGGAGFIATNFVYYWLERHPNDQLVILDALTYAGNRDNLRQAEDNPNIEFIHGNILDQPLLEYLLSTRHIDTIVHFAAESHVDRSIHGPDEFIQTNIVGTHTLLKAAKISGWTPEPPDPTGFTMYPRTKYTGHWHPTIHPLPRPPRMRPTPPMPPAKPHPITWSGHTIKPTACRPPSAIAPTITALFSFPKN